MRATSNVCFGSLVLADTCAVHSSGTAVRSFGVVLELQQVVGDVAVSSCFSRGRCLDCDLIVAPCSRLIAETWETGALSVVLAVAAVLADLHATFRPS